MTETTILNEKQFFCELTKYIGKNKAKCTIDMMKSGILAEYILIGGYSGLIVCKKLDEDKFEFIYH